MNKVELQVPPEIYERVQQIAHAMNRPIEAVFLDSLTLLFGMLPQVTPDQLEHFTDEQLWAVVHQRLSASQDSQLRELISRGKQERLTNDEKAELERLINIVDQYMLLRSQALLLLKQRGHDVEQQLKLGM